MAKYLDIFSSYTNETGINTVSSGASLTSLIQAVDYSRVLLRGGTPDISGTQTFKLMEYNYPMFTGLLEFNKENVDVISMKSDTKTDSLIYNQDKGFIVNTIFSSTKDFLELRKESEKSLIDLSGLKINKYDGINDLLIGSDNKGLIRVGNEHESKQALLTRADNLNNSKALIWDASTKQAETTDKYLDKTSSVQKVLGNTYWYSKQHISFIDSQDKEYLYFDKDGISSENETVKIRKKRY